MDCSHATYRDLLVRAKRRWRLQPLSEAVDPLDTTTALWRHDIDESPAAALALAKIENDLGVSAIYYVMIRNEFYDLADKGSYAVLKEIASLGHSIGLHYDAGTIHGSYSAALDWVPSLLLHRDEATALLDCAIQGFSFHNPSNTGWIEARETSYGGIFNAYAKSLSPLEYCSDSGGQWRFRTLTEVLEDPRDRGIYILTHPENWGSHPS